MGASSIANSANQRPIQCEQTPRFELDLPLVRFLTDHEDHHWSLRHACENAQIFGRIGSGKTSGSGWQFAKAFVEAGFGGLVLSAKPTDLSMWERLCHRFDRDVDLLVFDATGEHRFNFMDYELKRQGDGPQEVGSISNLLTQINEIQQPRSGGGGENAEFWRSNLERLINNALQIAIAADGTASLAAVEKMITSAPKSLQQREDSGWQASSMLAQAMQRVPDPEDDDPFASDIQRAIDYWGLEYPMMDERTRSNILASFQGIADRFLRGNTRRLFCSDTTIVPEMTHLGKIIFLNLPPADHGPFGRMAQVLFKYVWQQATLRRQASVDELTRPVFLWVDESQEFVTSADADFLNRCRDSKAGAVFLTQSLANYNAKLGRDYTLSLLGSLNTKVFHSLACAETAQYATDLIGQTRQLSASYNTPAEQPETGFAKPNSSFSESFQHQVHPRQFYDLRSGGPANGKWVDSILVQGGRTWSPSGANYLRWSMQQE